MARLFRGGSSSWILAVGFILLGLLNLAANPDFPGKAYAQSSTCVCSENCAYSICGDGNPATCQPDGQGGCACTCPTCPVVQEESTEE